ncbi:hypothetical protein TWF506_009259 [Arthrobotrys conoides]|uniref:Uncharacterized protein n=1 Tax=Arthrobotrys conoides TaxID=74498 RepID=A0AAN8NUV8_9PEZI
MSKVSSDGWGQLHHFVFLVQIFLLLASYTTPTTTFALPSNSLFTSSDAEEPHQLGDIDGDPQTRSSLKRDISGLRKRNDDDEYPFGNENIGDDAWAGRDPRGKDSNQRPNSESPANKDVNEVSGFEYIPPFISYRGSSPDLTFFPDLGTFGVSTSFVMGECIDLVSNEKMELLQPSFRQSRYSWAGERPISQVELEVSTSSILKTMVVLSKPVARSLYGPKYFAEGIYSAWKQERGLGLMRKMAFLHLSSESTEVIEKIYAMNKVDKSKGLLLPVKEDTWDRLGRPGGENWKPIHEVNQNIFRQLREAPEYGSLFEVLRDAQVKSEQGWLLEVDSLEIGLRSKIGDESGYTMLFRLAEPRALHSQAVEVEVGVSTAVQGSDNLPDVSPPPQDEDISMGGTGEVEGEQERIRYEQTIDTSDIVFATSQRGFRARLEVSKAVIDGTGKFNLGAAAQDKLERKFTRRKTGPNLPLSISKVISEPSIKVFFANYFNFAASKQVEPPQYLLQILDDLKSAKAVRACKSYENFETGSERQYILHACSKYGLVLVTKTPEADAQGQISGLADAIYFA